MNCRDSVHTPVNSVDIRQYPSTLFSYSTWCSLKACCEYNRLAQSAHYLKKQTKKKNPHTTTNTTSLNSDAQKLFANEYLHHFKFTFCDYKLAEVGSSNVFFAVGFSSLNTGTSSGTIRKAISTLFILKQDVQICLNRLKLGTLTDTAYVQFIK